MQVFTLIRRENTRVNPCQDQGAVLLTQQHMLSASDISEDVWQPHPLGQPHVPGMWVVFCRLVVAWQIAARSMFDYGHRKAYWHLMSSLLQASCDAATLFGPADFTHSATRHPRRCSRHSRRRRRGEELTLCVVQRLFCRLMTSGAPSGHLPPPR